MATLSTQRRRAAVAAAVSLTALGTAAAAWAGASTHTADHRVGRPPAGLAQATNRLVADGQPGVIVLTRRGGRVAYLTAGVADRATGAPMRPEDRFHIGSATKTFVAAVILQLAAEHRLSLDDSIQKWLPGVIDAHGYDPAKITIRQVLQQTSGLRDYSDVPGAKTLPMLEKVWRPRQLIASALRLGPPLRGWHYANTNYILAGELIQRVTGHSPMHEIERRILRPLRLKATSFPLRSKQIPGPHAHGYLGGLDVTTLFSPTGAWTAGAMISNVDDLARFYRALLTGRLLPPPQMRALLGTMAVNDVGELFPEHYGLGIYRVQLPCGTAWGHDGGYPGGFRTFDYTSRTGRRQAVIVYNNFAISDGADNPTFRRDLLRATKLAFCG